MSSKHTPGRWWADTGARGSSAYVYSKENGDDVDVCDVPHRGDDDQVAATANLIAAAPDLLEACEMAERFMRAIDVDAGDYSAYRSDFDAIVAAIKRARGE